MKFIFYKWVIIGISVSLHLKLELSKKMNNYIWLLKVRAANCNVNALKNIANNQNIFLLGPIINIRLRNKKREVVRKFRTNVMQKIGWSKIIVWISVSKVMIKIMKQQIGRVSIIHLDKCHKKYKINAHISVHIIRDYRQKIRI